MYKYISSCFAISIKHLINKKYTHKKKNSFNSIILVWRLFWRSQKNLNRDLNVINHTALILPALHYGSFGLRQDVLPVEWSIQLKVMAPSWLSLKRSRKVPGSLSCSSTLAESLLMKPMMCLMISIILFNFSNSNHAVIPHMELYSLKT